MRGPDKKLRIDLTNKKFGRLLVISFAYSDGKGNYWECLCDCGKTIFASTGNLNFKLQSCGCLITDTNTKHGFYSHPLYNVYRGMLKRCYNKKDKYYYLYGERGISVCKEWIDNPKSFFDWAISNGYKKGLELDRYPNQDGNYTPENCRWATPKQNCNNTRKNVLLTLNGKTLTIPQWADELNMSVFSIRARYYKYSHTVEEILSKTPLHSVRKRTKRGSYKNKVKNEQEQSGNQKPIL